MTKKSEMYKCEICGNVVLVELNGPGELVCCNKPMTLYDTKNDEEGTEKHKPVLTIDGSNVNVKVGSVEHPMTEEHYIVCIELLKDDIVIAEKRLKPLDKPEVNFCIKNTKGIKARSYCNVHGLWSN